MRTIFHVVMHLNEFGIFFKANINKEKTKYLRKFTNKKYRYEILLN